MRRLDVVQWAALAAIVLGVFNAVTIALVGGSVLARLASMINGVSVGVALMLLTERARYGRTVNASMTRAHEAAITRGEDGSYFAVIDGEPALLDLDVDYDPSDDNGASLLAAIARAIEARK